MSAFISWYLIIQLISILIFPLSYQFFRYLPDRGYTLSKTFGVLLVGFTFWIGFCYGVLRNETGGAWLALLIIFGVAYTVGHRRLQRNSNGQHAIVLYFRQNIRLILTTELLFLIAFAGWTLVRAHDPAVNHTEQPMDLMFMNGLWSSPTYPPHDPWLAGYAISYYYFGYWLVITIGRLSGQPPEIAYNLGQACWYGLLLVGCFGVMFNLLTLYAREKKQNSLTPIIGSIFAASVIGLAGNLEVIPEWLYAQGVDITSLASWLNVHEFPERAAVTHQWYISMDGWWWRSSRIIQDLNLLGQRIDASPITETPIFSYILGDNHPHVLAMPFMLLLIAVALNLFSTPIKPFTEFNQKEQTTILESGKSILANIPLNLPRFLLITIMVGAPLFLNTWDFPPYWLLSVLAFYFIISHFPGKWAVPLTSGFAVALIIGAMLLYLPYFLTAQSQASGLIPNFFYPTALPQFLLIFGHFWVGIGILLRLAWQESSVTARQSIILFTTVIALPCLFLIVTGLLVFRMPSQNQSLPELPVGDQTYFSFMVKRWLAQPWTYLLNGSTLALVIGLVWSRLTNGQNSKQSSVTFVLLLAGVGLSLTYAPEFIYLRDNFGTRMNTIFKFYYQGWLLLGLAAVFGVVAALRHQPTLRLLAGIALVFFVVPLIYPLAGIYSKTNGFQSSTLTLNAIAHIAQSSPDEMAAIEWIRRTTPANAVVVESEGDSYNSTHNRISTSTGRQTLIGWGGHEAQWRGTVYATMAEGRSEALTKLYRSGSTSEIEQILKQWNIDYVYVGPVERQKYQMNVGSEARLKQMMTLVFEHGSISIYQRKG